MKRASPEVRALARRAADVAAEASLDGLDAATAVMAAAIHVSFSSDMSNRDIADWLRRLAAELENDEQAAYGARIRRAMREGEHS
jgi:hypothetical protein